MRNDQTLNYQFAQEGKPTNKSKTKYSVNLKQVSIKTL